MKKFKYLSICSIILTTLFTNIAFAKISLVYDGIEHEYTAEPITLIVNKKVITPPMPPVIIDERTLVPARAIFEEFGADILWLPETKEIFITLYNKILKLKIDDNVAFINDTPLQMEVPPKIINDSTMIPLRFVAESFGLDVGWDSKSRIATVNSKAQPTETQQPSIDINENTTEKSTTNESTSNSSNTNGVEQPTNSFPIVDNQEPNNTYDFNTIGEVLRFKSENIYSDTNTNLPITTENYDLVNIIGVDFPTNGDETFKIRASGKISGVTYGVIENPIRLFVDIQNSISKLDSTISGRGSSIVDSIRTSQQADSINTTRIVFDLPSGQNYNIYLSENRMTLNIKFKPVIINEITLQSSTTEDIINIYANSILAPIISELNNTNTVMIDIPNSISNIGSKASNVKANAISAIRTSQFDTNTVRIAIDTTSTISYSITTNNLVTTIRITKPEYKNISYDSISSPKLTLKKDVNYNIDVNSIEHQDKYLEGYYKIVLPSDYSQIYGHGQYKINDKYLDSIEIQNVGGKTELIFNEKNIYAYTVTEDNSNIYINILNPKDVYKKVVYIDAGHGGAAPGNINNGVTEKVVNLDVSNRLYLLLENDPNIKVYSTRTTDVDMERPKRASLGSVGDMFVSIHCNSLDNPSVSGVQVFYPNPSDTRGMLSKEMATIFNKTVSSRLGIPIRPADQTLGYDYTVLLQSTVPACLIELGFLTNTTDAKILASPEGRQAAAQGIYEGIQEAFATVIPSR